MSVISLPRGGDEDTLWAVVASVGRKRRTSGAVSGIPARHAGHRSLSSDCIRGHGSFPIYSFYY